MKRAALAVAAAVLVVGPAPVAAATPGPPNAPEYWFDDWQVQSLWDGGTRGQGITIAEIDTGVAADLPELRGRVLPGIDLGHSGDGRIDRDVDGFGHGTAMASIMVARPGLLDITGLAPDAKILPIAVALSGTTDADRPDKLPEAIRYAADHSAKIINMSLGGKRSQKEDGVPCSSEEQAAVYYAMRRGALVIASVGNTGPTDNAVEDPGVCLGVISVGAIDSAGKVADFSGRQPYLTLVAPGVNVPSLGRDSGTAYSGEGTSQATALTSAAAALVWSAHPELDAKGVATRILATLDERQAKPLSAEGYGRLNAYRAVTAQVPGEGETGQAGASNSATNPVYEAAEPFAARAESLRKAQPDPPAPAAKPFGSTGSFEVGTHPRLSPDVMSGIAMAGAGAVLLLLLLGIGVRGRLRRRRRVPAYPLPVYPVPAYSPMFAPAPPLPVPPARVPAPLAAPHRPRPGPGPRPSAVIERPRPRPRPHP